VLGFLLILPINVAEGRRMARAPESG